MSSLFNQSIKSLKGVGDKRASLLKKLGVSSIGELLYLYPRSYEDWSNPIPISQAPCNAVCCIKGIVADNVIESRIRDNLVLYKFRIYNVESFVTVSFFNTPFIKKQIEKDKEIFLRGTIKQVYGHKEITCPTIMNASSKPYIKPIYPQVSGLLSSQISVAMGQALSMLPEEVKDPLDDNLREKYSLCTLNFALHNVHFPKSMETLETAKRRLVFEELLVLQLGMHTLKLNESDNCSNFLANNLTDEFASLLPFSLTDAQKKVISECMNDMTGKSGSYSMTRLIQGDVGSGKTAVCAALCYNTVKNGGQVALMAPTEILACQHYYWFSKIFYGCGISIRLLTGSTTASKKDDTALLSRKGEVDIVIGTHALISDKIQFLNLVLVITDEQHRFGVSQRSKLTKKGNIPHMLVMSATPIPRTLSFIIYGDLDISIINEKPCKRKPVETLYITSDKRHSTMEFIGTLISSGQQGYIVCPVVEKTDRDLISVIAYYETISKEHLKNYKVEILHGKMKSKDKSEIMHKFVKGDIDVLVSTTVIEVGIDVPNATFIVIENAERFGLAQLHQLRGRVGRGNQKSYCVLVSDAKGEETSKRLKIMTETSDGFEIANEDLKIRGPGDFLGNRQHGIPEMKCLDLKYDLSAIIQETKLASREIILKDKYLEKHRVLKAQINLFFKGIKMNIS